MPTLRQKIIEEYNLQESGWPISGPDIKESLVIRTDLCGKKFGDHLIVSPIAEILGRKNDLDLYVRCMCVKCEYTKIIRMKSLSRSSAVCRFCNPALDQVQYPKWLYNRMSSLKSRCTNSNDPNYRKYGALGIEFGWHYATDAAKWIFENLGADENHRKMMITRIDNSGNFEIGNLKWSERLIPVSTYEGMSFKSWMSRFTVMYPDVIYSNNSFRSFLRSGMTSDQIAERFKESNKNPKGK